MGECMNAGARSAIRALSRPGTGHRGASRDCRGHDQGGERPGPGSCHCITGE